MRDAIDRARAAAFEHLGSRLVNEAARKKVVAEALELFDEALEALVEDGDLTERQRITEGEILEIQLYKEPLRGARPPVQSTPARRGPVRQPKARDPLNPAQLTSPFRFVALNPVVVPPQPEVLACGINTPLAGGFCGTIDVEWAAETPLLIGEERRGDGAEYVGPMRLGGVDGDWIIPGSTIRGSLRAAMEIIASGYLSQINAHHVYGLRDFDHPLFRPEDPAEADKSLLQNTNPGWLRRVQGTSGETARYEIVPCQSWHTIAIADLPDRQPDGSYARFCHGDGQYQWRSGWLATEIDQRYRRIGRPVDPADKTIHFDKDLTHTFTTAPDGHTGDLVPAVDGTIRGTLVFSDRSPSAPSADVIKAAEIKGGPGQAKKREYVFVDYPAGTAPAPIPVHPDAWKRFELINTSPGRRKREPSGSWEKLHRSLDRPNGRVPIFYAREGQALEFGLTRFFKIAHAHSVGVMRDRARKHQRPTVAPGTRYPIDFVEALFGHVFDHEDVFGPDHGLTVAPADVARKGRVAFQHARLITPREHVRESDIIRTVMGTPKASFAPFYLAGQFKDYSAPDGQTTGLAGRKRYFPRFTATTRKDAEAAITASLQRQISRLTINAQENDRTQTRLRLLRPRTVGEELDFRGTIRLHNVSAVEVGALLWALTHGGDPGKPYRHMMGHARMLGAGQMRVRSVVPRLRPNDDAARAKLGDPAPWERGKDGHEPWIPANAGYAHGMSPFLEAFHLWMEKEEHRPDWLNQTDMRDFLAISRPETGAAIVASRGLDTEGLAAYPRLGEGGNVFGLLRRASKLRNGYAAPHKRPERYLAALPPDEHPIAPKLPYRGSTKDRGATGG